MNELSLMLYMADVSGSIRHLIRVTGFFLIVFSLGRTFVSVSNKYGPFMQLDACQWHHKVTAFGVALFVLSALIPSSSTIYAIAASEMGEDVLNSETGGKAVEALNAWLDRQIADD